MPLRALHLLVVLLVPCEIPVTCILSLNIWCGGAYLGAVFWVQCSALASTAAAAAAACGACGAGVWFPRWEGLRVLRTFCPAEASWPVSQLWCAFNRKPVHVPT